MLALLPTELKTIIIEQVDKRSLPAVLRTNSNLREITEPILYSVIWLSPFYGDIRPAMQCFRAMVARPSIAAAVRTLHVCLQYPRGYEKALVLMLLNAMGDALVKLGNLQKLELSGWDDRSRSSRGHLPRGSPLPSLQHYYGPPEVIDNIQSSVLATIRITSWRPIAVEISRAISTAAQYSAMTLRALEIVRDMFDDDEEWLGIVLRIPHLFPKLIYLGLGDWPKVDDDHLIDRLVPGLAPLGDLRLFYIAEGRLMGPVIERRLVRRLHEGCPQLRAISLGADEWRFSDELQQWAPPPSLPPFSLRTTEIWRMNDCQKYLVDAKTDGFEYQLLEEWV